MKGPVYQGGKADIPDDHWIHKAIAKSGMKPVKLERDTKAVPPAGGSNSGPNDKSAASANPAPTTGVIGPSSPKADAQEAATGSAPSLAAANSPPSTGVGVPLDQRATFDFVKNLGMAVNNSLQTNQTKQPKAPKGQ